MKHTQLPTFDTMMNPLIQALHELGGSGTIQEINNKVADILQLTDEQLDIQHDPSKSSLTEIGYRLTWTRSYLKKFGILENSSRGVWAFTPEGSKFKEVKPKKVVSYVREQRKAKKERETQEENIEEIDETISWRDEVLEILSQMHPSAFERLSRRILREAGFTQVEVTGGSGDGGIDGTGILRLGGFISFQVLFQCKRWKGSVGAGVIRDFRGAMVGRADKGLIITTSYFTQDAIKEATRDGAPAIDLIDGDLLIDRLKELNLGIVTKEVITEEVLINHEWFKNL